MINNPKFSEMEKLKNDWKRQQTHSELVLINFWSYQIKKENDKKCLISEMIKNKVAFITVVWGWLTTQA